MALRKNRKKVEAINIEKMAKDFGNCEKVNSFWKNIDIEKRDTELVFFATGSHYYMSIINRYTFVANYFSDMLKMDF